ncbi:MAG TPA: iron chaperone [Candidatus Limnocylindria bacterium]|nr:iron chaperone [Candidatus Limnocylindria bacterium]
MEEFKPFLDKLENPLHRARAEEVFSWIIAHFPGLGRRLGWNQPMFTDHGTFIVSFSAAKHHLAVAPEPAAMERFAQDIGKAGYSASMMLYRVPWDKPMDYELLRRIIEFNITDKKDVKTFWRPRAQG